MVGNMTPEMNNEPDVSVRISAEKVNFHYGDGKHALHDITMPLYDRHITALIGPSGCGKSTFLRCLNRMNEEIDPLSRLEGSVTLDGVDLYGAQVDLPELRKPHRYGVPETEPFPGEHLR